MVQNSNIWNKRKSETRNKQYILCQLTLYTRRLQCCSSSIPRWFNSIEQLNSKEKIPKCVPDGIIHSDLMRFLSSNRQFKSLFLQRRLRDMLAMVIWRIYPSVFYRFFICLTHLKIVETCSADISFEWLHEKNCNISIAWLESVESGPVTNCWAGVSYLEAGSSTLSEVATVLTAISFVIRFSARNKRQSMYVMRIWIC